MLIDSRIICHRAAKGPIKKAQEIVQEIVTRRSFQRNNITTPEKHARIEGFTQKIYRKQKDRRYIILRTSCKRPNHLYQTEQWMTK